MDRGVWRRWRRMVAATALLALAGSSAAAWVAPAPVLAAHGSQYQTGSLGVSSGAAQASDTPSPDPTPPPHTPYIPPVTITTALLPTAQQGSAYTATLSVTGGTAPYTWSVPSGSTLPPGLTLSPSGVLSGTPTQPGTSSFTVQVTAAGPVLPTPPPGPPFPHGFLYPPGFPFLPGFLFPSGYPGQGDHRPFHPLLPFLPPNQAVTVLSLTVQPTVLVTTTALPDGQIDTPYVQLLTAGGGSGSGSFLWTLAAGSSLPAGLQLSPTGLLTGTPTVSGTTSFTVDVADGSTPQFTTPASFSLSVLPSTMRITTALLPNGQVGSAYSEQLAATGGTPGSSGGYSWQLIEGTSLPAGLTLSPAGLISGSPTAPGTVGFIVQATDSGSTTAGQIPAQQTATASLTITVTPSSTVSITTSSLPNGQVGVSYGYFLAASGGQKPYTWTASGLPTGLAVSPEGLLAGTPQQSGTFHITLNVSDSSVPANTASTTLSLTVAATQLQIQTNSLPGGQVGTAYSQTLKASGGTTPYTWSVTNGSLPNGLTLSPDGTISGTPVTPLNGTNGESTFTVKATDSSSPAETATAELSITIKATGLAISTVSLPDGAVGDQYSATLTATGGQSPYQFALAPCTSSSCPTLPGGLALLPSGTIQGTPQAATQGTYTFEVQVTDSEENTASASLSLTIEPPLTVTTTGLPAGAQGDAYSATLTAKGGVGADTWSVSSGSSLPGGLSLNSSGKITGTPTVSGSFSVGFTVTDSKKGTASATLTISLAPPVSVAVSGTTSVSGGAKVNLTVTASGGLPSYTWSESSLPSWLSASSSGANADTLTVSGTAPSPKSSTKYTFSVKVTDSDQGTASQSITVTVG